MGGFPPEGRALRDRPAGRPLAPPAAGDLARPRRHAASRDQRRSKLSRAPLPPEAHAPGVQPKTIRLASPLFPSVLPEFISQDYRFGFLAVIKYNSNIASDSSGPRTGRLWLLRERKNLARISILDSQVLFSPDPPPSIDPPRCSFRVGSRLRPRKGQFSPCPESPKPGNSVCSAHSTNTSPAPASQPA
jgi:hypothetical protein